MPYAHDACYVVLAQRVGAPLVTADARLVRAMRARGLDARDLRRPG
jgi:predicted nucleic acid-binding protein